MRKPRFTTPVPCAPNSWRGHHALVRYHTAGCWPRLTLGSWASCLVLAAAVLQLGNPPWFYNPWPRGCGQALRVQYSTDTIGSSQQHAISPAPSAASSCGSLLVFASTRLPGSPLVLGGKQDLLVLSRTGIPGQVLPHASALDLREGAVELPAPVPQLPLGLRVRC